MKYIEVNEISDESLLTIMNDQTDEILDGAVTKTGG